MTSSEIDSYFAEVIANFFGGLLSLGFIIFVIEIAVLVGMVALITWIVIKVWNAGKGKSKNKKRHSDGQNEDWLYSAQRRENAKFDYLNNHMNKNRNKSGGYTGNRQSGVKWYPTGWVFNERTQLWEPPDYLRKESNDKWKWDPDKEIWVDLEKEARMEKYRKYHEGQPPTFEEWKANKLKQEIDSTPANTTTEQGTYRYDYIHLADDETHFPRASAAQTADSPVESERPEKTKSGYEDFYEARPILSYNESRNYKTLKEVADRKGYTVHIKMRLADIVQPRKGQYYDKYEEANFHRISQKHVDFTILNERMKIIAIIELDDNSHDQPDRQERDEKVDSILQGNGIKVIHTRHITDDILDNI